MNTVTLGVRILISLTTDSAWRSSRGFKRKYGPFSVDYFVSDRSYQMRPFMARLAA